MFFRRFRRDIAFAAVNGGVFGLMAPIIVYNLNPSFSEPKSLVFPLSAAFFSLGAAAAVCVGALFHRRVPVIFQIAKFGIIGATNTVIDFGVLNLLLFLSPVEAGAPVGIYKTISFTVAVINSYFWNKFWTFERKDTSRVPGEFAQFAIISVIGAVLNVAVTVLVSAILATEIVAVGVNIGAAVASLTVLLWNFLGYKFIVFKK